MKNQLLCTSAIVLGCAVAAPASAQDWDVNWGGFMSQHVGFGDISGTGVPAGRSYEGDGLDIHSTSEIFFTPSVTLDNGLTFGVNIEFEGEQNALTEVDESYMIISGDSFGTLEIGSENSAGYKMLIGAPGVTSMWINSPSTSTFIPFTGTGTVPTLGSGLRQAFLSSYTEVAGNNDVQRISYYTPSFNGLTIGVSYAPTGSVNVANSYSVNTNAVLSDVFDIGVAYSQSFGGTDLYLAARWGTGDGRAGRSDPETWGVGFNVGFNSITIGGSYAENDNGLTAAQAVGGGGGDSEGWSLGVTYDAAGPWSFELLTYQGELDNHLAVGDTLDREAYRIGASRDLGPGVDWDIYILHEERDRSVTAGTDVEGTVLGTGINLNF